jgi:hypothetical protein
MGFIPPELKKDPRLEHPGAAWDPDGKTVYGARAEFEDFDTAALGDHATRVVVVQAMQYVEFEGDQVDGFKQVGRRILVCPKGSASTQSLKVCWECRWLAKAHRPDCAWKAVKDVSEL